MGRIFWNLIARIAFIVGFITASAHATAEKHEVPNAPKGPSKGLSSKEQVYKYCMPGAAGIVCRTETNKSLLIGCAKPLTSPLYNVRRAGEKLSDETGKPLTCEIIGASGEEESAPSLARRGSPY